MESYPNITARGLWNGPSHSKKQSWLPELNLCLSFVPPLSGFEHVFLGLEEALYPSSFRSLLHLSGATPGRAAIAVTRRCRALRFSSPRLSGELVCRVSSAGFSLLC